MPALPGSLALTGIADGALITAVDHRNNYAALQTAVNALIADLGGAAAGALLQGISSSSIGYLPDVPADGQRLVWNAASGRWKPDAGVSKYGTLIDVVNTVTETDILQAAGYTILANAMGANGDVRITIHGDYLNNTGGTTTIRPKVYWGGVALIDPGVSFAVAAGANRRPFWLQLILSNLGATNAQQITGVGVLGAGPAPFAGIGAFDKLDAVGTDGQFIDLGTAGSAAVDTTVNQTVRVTVTLGSAVATHELRIRKSIVEII